ncbi:hypothetical protein OG741_37605 [Streptomyces sp. NBC_01410]|uniref:hypothetical protein n=1 Tax=Streptomyces sp. NBC_01410 TaxID=2903856 RepID=UPI00325236FD
MHLIDELAALRSPMPKPGSVTPADCYDDACEQTEQQRKDDALHLEAASDGLEMDPLLLALNDARAEKESADARIRRLLAYGREFHGTRPYRLEDLARAAGYTVSGVRTAYAEDEISDVAAEINRKPNRSV